MLNFEELYDVYEEHTKDNYEFEKEVIAFINILEKKIGSNRWLSIGRTNIEQGFMALRKGILESHQGDRKAIYEARKSTNKGD